MTKQCHAGAGSNSLTHFVAKVNCAALCERLIIDPTIPILISQARVFCCMNIVLPVTGWDHAIAVFDNALLPMRSNAASDSLFECTINHCIYSSCIHIYCTFLAFITDVTCMSCMQTYSWCLNMTVCPYSSKLALSGVSRTGAVIIANLPC